MIYGKKKKSKIQNCTYSLTLMTLVFYEENVSEYQAWLRLSYGIMDCLFYSSSWLPFQNLENAKWRVRTEKTSISTWKNWSCFSRLQKNGCFSTCLADGRF